MLLGNLDFDSKKFNSEMFFFFNMNSMRDFSSTYFLKVTAKFGKESLDSVFKFWKLCDQDHDGPFCSPGPGSSPTVPLKSQVWLQVMSVPQPGHSPRRSRSRSQIIYLYTSYRKAPPFQSQ
jgi:hypothetical protein